MIKFKLNENTKSIIILNFRYKHGQKEKTKERDVNRGARGT